VSSGKVPTEEELTSLTIPLAVNTEELNRQINPNYKVRDHSSIFCAFSMYISSLHWMTTS